MINKFRLYHRSHCSSGNEQDLLYQMDPVHIPNLKWMINRCTLSGEKVILSLTTAACKRIQFHGPTKTVYPCSVYSYENSLCDIRLKRRYMNKKYASLGTAGYLALDYYDDRYKMGLDSAKDYTISVDVFLKETIP